MFHSNTNPFDVLSASAPAVYRVKQGQGQQKQGPAPAKMEFPSLSTSKAQAQAEPLSVQAEAFVDALQREKAFNCDANSVPPGHVRLTRDGAEYGLVLAQHPIDDHQFIQHHMAALCGHWARWRDNYIDINGLDAYNHFYMPQSYIHKPEDDASDVEAFSDDDDMYNDY